MYEEVEEHMRNERETAKRAECLERLVLAEREDHTGRKLLDYAERTAAQAPMQREKTITWLSLALRADGVDDSTLSGLGFNRQEVRHATVVQPLADETAMAYAERLAAYNEPEALAVGKAMLNEPTETNPTVPADTTNNARDAGINRLRRTQRNGQKRARARVPRQAASPTTDPRPRGWPTPSDGWNT